ncbi:hypothetical protein BASA81_002708 [Batrachochytrium salamandrivorans]|nr:hypothetical protein BASA81_002708 [Batrachochytrium salamandrivorans]
MAATTMTVATGTAPPVFLKTLRKHGGLAGHREEEWIRLLRPLREDKYKLQLQHAFDKCEGCQRLLDGHIYANVREFFLPKGSSLAVDLFAQHDLPVDKQDMVKRVLMGLECEFDFDNSYCFMDLVCLLIGKGGLEEAKAYGMVRKMVELNSSEQFQKSKRTGGSLLQRRLLLCMSPSSSFQLATVVVQLVGQKNAELARCLPIYEVQYWLDRWLVPILPLATVLVILDCMIAGDDAKLLLRTCLSAIWGSHHQLVERFARDPINFRATEVIWNTRPNVDLNFAVPKRRKLNQLLTKLPIMANSRFVKIPCAHVPKRLLKESSILNEFDLASEWAEMIPPSHRFGLFKMKQVVLRDWKLASLFHECKLVEDHNSAYMLLIRANVPSHANELDSSTTNRQVVFGVYSHSPFYIGADGGRLGAGSGSGFVFQLGSNVRGKSYPAVECQQQCGFQSMRFGQGALCFLDSLDRGTSEQCAVFNSPPLCCDEQVTLEPGIYCFTTCQVEVWVLPKT